jgi:hypothetical protein
MKDLTHRNGERRKQELKVDCYELKAIANFYRRVRRENLESDPSPAMKRHRTQDEDAGRIVRKPTSTGEIAYATMQRPHQKTRQVIFLRRAATASVQSWAAWKVAWGRLPSMVEICWGVMARRSEADLPMSTSVSAELQAIAATQP